MKKSNNKNFNKIAIFIASNHLYKGAMEGAENKDYIKATKECYQILTEFIDKAYQLK